MTVKEYTEQKIQELQKKGYKEVKVKDVIPCTLDEKSYSYELFSREKVSENAEVMPEWDHKGKTKGAMIWLNFIKPRCRKVSVDSFRVTLA